MDYRVEVTAATHPSVCVDIFDLDHEPTLDDISEALEDLAQQMNFEGYMAEFIVTEGGDWTTNILIEQST